MLCSTVEDYNFAEDTNLLSFVLFLLFLYYNILHISYLILLVYCTFQVMLYLQSKLYILIDYR